MSDRRAWKRLETKTAYSTNRVSLHRDLVTRPDGQPDTYDWVETADQVRVAAVVNGELLLIRQDHYLTGTALQLPGGGVEKGEDSRSAAERELRQETGLHRGSWTSYGEVCPLPSLSPARVHLWFAYHLELGPTKRESSEADVRAIRISMLEAVQAVRTGKVQCAASAALILAVSLDGSTQVPSAN
jgi:8-oxo-dGTP pyrophosphatase MutT (NUDIX family)